MTERRAPQYSGLDMRPDADPGPEDDWFTPEPAVAPTTTWTINGHLPAPSEAALTFRPPPWYRTKPAGIALLAAAAAAVTAPVVLLASHADAPPGPAQPTSVLPQAATSTGAPQTIETTPRSAGTPIDQLSPPPPAPPPPTDTATADSPRWSPTTHKSTAKPTTPTPITRTPISVSPAPRQAPVTATPGTNHHPWGGW